MEWLHLSGVSIIQVLQSHLQGVSDWLLMISHLGDPRNAFLIYFPLAFVCRPSLGLKVVWVAALAEYLNAMLKWLLHGQRPYWWIGETSLYGDTPPTVLQYPLTCETGPGSPSGHAMVTAAVWHTMVNALVKYKLRKSSHRFIYTLIAWTCFTAFIAAIAVSRCFIATHFPHQVAAGFLAGVLLSLVCDRFPTETFTIGHYVLASVFIMGSSLTFDVCLTLSGLDPSWSLTLASKWCREAGWVHLNTTPYNSVVRDTAAILGTGLGLAMLNGKRKYSKPNEYLEGAWPLSGLGLVLSLIVTEGSEYINIPQHSPLTFYVLTAVKYACLHSIIIFLIPGTLAALLHGNIRENEGRYSKKMS